MKTKKAQTKNRAPLRRWIVAWEAHGKSQYMTFPNLERARGCAKEVADWASRFIKGGYDEDGGLAALVESIRIYAAVLEPVEDSKRTTARVDSKRTTARNNR